MHLRFIGVRGASLRVTRAQFGKLDRFAFDDSLIHPITDFPLVESATGAQCSGQIVGLPTMPGPMLNNQEEAVKMMAKAVEKYGEGSDLVGLGALCAIVGLRGRALEQTITKPVTTGNSLTCWAAIETTAKLMRSFEPCPNFTRRILVVGLPGTMAMAAIGVMAQRGMPVEVFHPSFPKSVERKIAALEAETGRQIPRHTDLDRALLKRGIVVGAGSVGGDLASARLQPGTVVVDVAQPLDTSPQQRSRDDLLIVEGEMLSLPSKSGTKNRSFWSNLYNLVVGQADERVFACLAEPMVLCLEGRAEGFSIGRNLDVGKVEEIGTIAVKHGFGVRDLFRGRQRLDIENMRRFANIKWLDL